MKAAAVAVQRPATAKLLVVDSTGRLTHHARPHFAMLLHAGDLVVANDAATLPASLAGRHLRSGRPIEVRLAGHGLNTLGEVSVFSAVVFGAGNFRMRTEDRPPPPRLAAGDWLTLGPLTAVVEKTLDHPRLISISFKGTPGEIWEGLARHGRPIQYSHLPAPLAIWDSWTAIAGPPVAFEPPSAGFIIDWDILASMSGRGIRFATITHAAGLSSTGDAALDSRLPFDEPYHISDVAAAEIESARARRKRIIAVGTTVVRALEHCAANDGVIRSGNGTATQRITAQAGLRVVDALLSGTHEPGTSHYELLRAFTDEGILRRADAELNSHNYRTHEFGDWVFIERHSGRLSGLPHGS
ncbi:MAG TPA: S-adenosylmethionine:tRNA ribosyltransferase-isomerase [Bryobacteraceae bacterium]|nr:S-adenosylmethionine:tRNA ribosyltransferase-isomerase [Bryobacteraceae bacterium]